MTDYRNDAKRRLVRAKNELASADDARLIYATLELRMAIESITYDRALAYKKEFPPREYETWQPKKVMAELLDIDPSGWTCPSGQSSCGVLGIWGSGGSEVRASRAPDTAPESALPVSHGDQPAWQRCLVSSHSQSRRNPP